MSEDQTTGTAGDMGVSSERVGPAGPGQVGTDGTRDVSEHPGAGPDTGAGTGAGTRAGTAPEQSADGSRDVHPDAPAPPVSGYNSHDPRSDDHPFETDGPRSEGGA